MKYFSRDNNEFKFKFFVIKIGQNKYFNKTIDALVANN